ncbi:uncharacterized protein LOC127734963 isoform X2 [Mytilus californianus]|uniref:uncharacterized protein LOC127734963 isoform X2 n=1 Tax=Mytilus californianus TaxID=6549 RepID=UPI0022483B4A|nr:uncharacterized protein LOC127734963 isoform X2 [Mytilus californianus]
MKPRKVYIRRPPRPFTYASLIRQAIVESPNRNLTLSEIYRWLHNAYSYKQIDDITTMKNNARQVLSFNKCFVRVTNEKNEGVWTVNEKEFDKLIAPHRRLDGSESVKNSNSVIKHKHWFIKNTKQQPEQNDHLYQVSQEAAVNFEVDDCNGELSRKAGQPEDNEHHYQVSQDTALNINVDGCKEVLPRKAGEPEPVQKLQNLVNKKPF